MKSEKRALKTKLVYHKANTNQEIQDLEIVTCTATLQLKTFKEAALNFEAAANQVSKTLQKCNDRLMAHLLKKDQHFAKIKMLSNRHIAHQEQ